MKNTKKYILIIVIAVLVLSLVSCSRQRDSATMAESPASAPSSSMMKSEADMAYSEEMAKTDADNSLVTGGGGGNESTSISAQFPQSATRKLVVNSSLELETKSFDDGVTLIQQKTTEYGGYIESSYFYGGEISDPTPARSVSYTLRIPAEKAAQFLLSLEKGEFNILNSSQYVEDITEAYFDIQAELDSYLEQKTSLEALRAKEGDLEYLILVEQEIARVNTEINRLHNSLKNMDSLVNYSTISLTISEVVEYVEPNLPTVTFGQRIINTINNTLKGTVSGGQNFVLFLIASIPGLIIIGILVFIGLKIKKRVDKSNKEKKEARGNNPPVIIDYTTHNSGTVPPADNPNIDTTKTDQ